MALKPKQGMERSQLTLIGEISALESLRSDLWPYDDGGEHHRIIVGVIDAKIKRLQKIYDDLYP